MPEQQDPSQTSGESQNVEHDPGMPQAASPPEGESSTGSSAGEGSPAGDVQDEGLAEQVQSALAADDPGGNGGKLPPPTAHRPDTVVRAVSPEARQEMERGGTFGNQPSFTKGVNAPPTDQSRYPYTVEQMDEILTEAPPGLFPDTPGGDGATPLSADREHFLATMGNLGHFPSQRETERWARAVFNAMRQRAIGQDDALESELKSTVRVGEAPEVQVEEMMWGGDFVDRMSRLLSIAGTWSRAEFYEQVAEEAGETPDDPWVDAAVHSFLGTLKSFLGDESGRMANLGELQSIWERV